MVAFRNSKFYNEVLALNADPGCEGGEGEYG